jgi:hypothetical protein
MEAVRILTREMQYRLLEAAKRVPLDKIPARPEGTTIRVS